MKKIKHRLLELLIKVKRGTLAEKSLIYLEKKEEALWGKTQSRKERGRRSVWGLRPESN